MLRKFRDDMGREVTLARPPQRIVSLVPSETETLFDLGLGDRVVGRTTFCEEPAENVASIPTVGGTKDLDVEAICELEPDLVFANQEENSRAPLEELAGRGVRLFVSFPKRVADGVALVARIARVCGVESSEPVKRCVEAGYRAVREASERENDDPLTVFVPIWLDPLMTISEHTFGSDMLRLAGARNVFADRERSYPLKADLGLRSPLPADQVANRDKRYPRVTGEEVAERGAAAVLLPDEPYAFTDADAAAFAAGSEAPLVEHISGKDLFWYGSRIPAALARLSETIHALKQRAS